MYVLTLKVIYPKTGESRTETFYGLGLNDDLADKSGCFGTDYVIVSAELTHAILSA